jgi:hypothetical protein
MSTVIEAMVHYGTVCKANSQLGYLVSTCHPCHMRHHGNAISLRRPGSAISHLLSIVATPVPEHWGTLRFFYRTHVSPAAAGATVPAVATPKCSSVFSKHTSSTKSLTMSSMICSLYLFPNGCASGRSVGGNQNGSSNLSSATPPP